MKHENIEFERILYNDSIEFDNTEIVKIAKYYINNERVFTPGVKPIIISPIIIILQPQRKQKARK